MSILQLLSTPSHISTAVGLVPESVSLQSVFSHPVSSLDAKYPLGLAHCTTAQLFASPYVSLSASLYHVCPGFSRALLSLQSFELVTYHAGALHDPVLADGLPYPSQSLS